MGFLGERRVLAPSAPRLCSAGCRKAPRQFSRCSPAPVRTFAGLHSANWRWRRPRARSGRPGALEWGGRPGWEARDGGVEGAFSGSGASTGSRKTFACPRTRLHRRRKFAYDFGTYRRKELPEGKTRDEGGRSPADRVASINDAARAGFAGRQPTKHNEQHDIAQENKPRCLSRPRARARLRPSCPTANRIDSFIGWLRAARPAFLRPEDALPGAERRDP